MGALVPNHPEFCDLEYLRISFLEYMLTIPLIKKQLADLHVDDITSFTSECNVLKIVISRNFESNYDIIDIYILVPASGPIKSLQLVS